MADDSTEPEATDPEVTDPEVTDAEVTDSVAQGDEAGSGAEAKKAETKKTKSVEAPKPPVVRKKVVSKRVTPKGGPVNTRAGGQARGATRGSTAARAHAPDGDDADYSNRYTPPTAKYADGPSPTWVPVLMFALLGLGGLLIVLNYAGVFGDADNVRLIIGLVLILGGIITATNLR